MSKRQRDYKAEYAHRKAKGISKGLSVSQARGHPKATEKHLSQKKVRAIKDADFQRALKELRSGKTLKEVARAIHVSPERLRNQASARKAIKRKGKRWMVREDLPRQMLIYSNGHAFTIVVGDFKAASAVGQYMAAVSKFLRSNQAIHLKPFIGQSVTDTTGHAYLFETRPNALYRLSAGNSESFEQVYRIIA